MTLCSACDCECYKTCRSDKYLDAKNCSCEKRLLDKSLLTYENNILNTIENSLLDKKVRCEKNNFLIHTL